MRLKAKFIVLLTAAISIGFAAAAWSQFGGGHGDWGSGGGGGYGGHGHGGGHMGGQGHGDNADAMKTMAKELKLSDDQNKQMQDLQLKYQPKIQDIIKSSRDGSITHDEALDRLQSINKDMQTDMTCILTPQQMEKAVAIMKRHPKGKGKNKANDAAQDDKFLAGPADELQKLSAGIKASDAEKKQIETAVDGYYSSLNALACKFSKQEINKEAFSSGIVSSRKDMLGGISQTISPDKQDLLASWMKDHQGVPEYLKISADDIAAAAVKADAGGK